MYTHIASTLLSEVHNLITASHVIYVTFSSQQLHAPHHVLASQGHVTSKSCCLTCHVDTRAPALHMQHHVH